MFQVDYQKLLAGLSLVLLASCAAEYEQNDGAAQGGGGPDKTSTTEAPPFQDEFKGEETTGAVLQEQVPSGRYAISQIYTLFEQTRNDYGTIVFGLRQTLLAPGRLQNNDQIEYLTDWGNYNTDSGFITPTVELDLPLIVTAGDEGLKFFSHRLYENHVTSRDDNWVWSVSKTSANARMGLQLHKIFEEGSVLKHEPHAGSDEAHINEISQRTDQLKVYKHPRFSASEKGMGVAAIQDGSLILTYLVKETRGSQVTKRTIRLTYVPIQ